MRWCAICDRVLSPSEFGRSKRSKDGLQTYCKRCHVRSTQRYREIRAEHIRELKHGPCVDCGLLLKDQLHMKRLEPRHTSRVSESKLRDMAGPAFARYVEGAEVVCVLCLDARINRKHVPDLRRGNVFRDQY